MQFLGFFSHGLAGDYLGDPNNWFDMLRTNLQAGVLLSIIFLDESVTEWLAFRASLAMLVFIMWVRALYSLRIYQVLGVPMLPIINAMGQIAPSCGVLLFYLCGFAHGYYTLDIKEDTIESLMVVYRLGLLGDFDMDEMEGVQPAGQLGGVGDNTFTIDGDPSENYYVA